MNLKFKVLLFLSVFILSLPLKAQNEVSFWSVEASCEFTQAVDNEGISGLLAVITKDKLNFEAELVITYFKGVKVSYSHEPISLVHRHSSLGTEVNQFIKENFLASYTLKKSPLDLSLIESIDYYNINPPANEESNLGHELVVFKDRKGLVLMKGARVKSFYVHCI